MSEWDEKPIEIEREEKPILPPAAVSRLLRHNDVLRIPENMAQVIEIKENCLTYEYGQRNEIPEVAIRASHEQARLLWSEFSQEEQSDLWIAPSKGGIFTTYERKVLRNEV